MIKILENFRLDGEKEDSEKVIENIDSGVEFKGTNLWILVFAIFIASLGLNVNSTAVVIGAMLVSPIMGPIIGLGMGMAINDIALLRKALYNYVFAIVIGLTTSTIYFALSPLHEASTEILSRTSPNIYDVLIALFGGFAGILAVSSKKKANVIPGVAIATALMPPLCTAGYGIANLNFAYFSGAIYLFVINTVFIALATLVTARFLKFPFKHLPEERDELIARRIVWVVVLLTVLPSIYFGYDIIQQNRFRQRANRFIANEAVFPNDYLLKRNIDAKAKRIQLTYGGQLIPENEIEALKSKLPMYELNEAELDVQQGFAYLADSGNGDEEIEPNKQLADVISVKDKEIKELQAKVAGTNTDLNFSKQIFAELHAQYPSIVSCIAQKVAHTGVSNQNMVWLVAISSDKNMNELEQKRIEEWLKVRIPAEQISLYFEMKPNSAPANANSANSSSANTSKKR